MATDVIALLADVLERKLDNPTTSVAEFVWERIETTNTNMPGMTVELCRLVDAFASFMSLHYATTAPEDGKALARQILSDVRFVAAISDFDTGGDHAQ